MALKKTVVSGLHSSDESQSFLENKNGAECAFRFVSSISVDYSILKLCKPIQRCWRNKASGRIINL